MFQTTNQLWMIVECLWRCAKPTGHTWSHLNPTSFPNLSMTSTQQSGKPCLRRKWALPFVLVWSSYLAMGDTARDKFTRHEVSTLL